MGIISLLCHQKTEVFHNYAIKHCPAYMGLYMQLTKFTGTAKNFELNKHPVNHKEQKWAFNSLKAQCLRETKSVIFVSFCSQNLAAESKFCRLWLCPSASSVWFSAAKDCFARAKPSKLFLYFQNTNCITQSCLCNLKIANLSNIPIVSQLQIEKSYFESIDILVFSDTITENFSQWDCIQR